MPVLVAYKTPKWIRVATRSFHEFFPEYEILVVDNNPMPGDRQWEPGVAEEQHWLKQQPWIKVISNPLSRMDFQCPQLARGSAAHGTALDQARLWCSDRGIQTMIIFEPDCVIRGRQWFEEFSQTIADGAWMASMLRTPFGPLKPCPSAWRIDNIHGTFAPVLREWALQHPQYTSLVDDKQMRKCVGEAKWKRFWSKWWDTGFNNWFFAAINGKARYIEARDENGAGDINKHDQTFAAMLERKDFFHAGSGSTALRNYLDETTDPEFIRLLSDDWKPGVGTNLKADTERHQASKPQSVDLVASVSTRLAALANVDNGSNNGTKRKPVRVRLASKAKTL